MKESAESRFWRKVLIGQQCWNWTAFVNPQGYGRFWDGKACVMAHRYSYILSNGDIPTGMQLDHLCRNRSCVNPAHLEAVTQTENVLRGVAPSAKHSQKTHCDSGHAFSEQNTRIRMSRSGRKWRVCKTCHKTRTRINNGVCPDCNRTFANLQRHMASKHKESDHAR